MLKETTYRQNVADLDGYVRDTDGAWPRIMRAPISDEDIRASQLAQFVAMYGHAISPWQADVLRAFPIVQRMFDNLSHRVSLPVMASTVQEEAPYATDDDVASLVMVPLDEEDCAVGDIVNDADVRGKLAASPAVRRVMALSDLRSDLDAAVDKVLEFYEYGKERLGDEFFMLVFYYGSFQKSSRVSMAARRAYIRFYVCHIGFADPPTITKPFFSETGLATESVESLMATAQSETACAPERFIAIRTLLRFFLSPWRT